MTGLKVKHRFGIIRSIKKQSSRPMKEVGPDSYREVLAMRASFIGIDVPSVVLSFLVAMEFQSAEGFHVSSLELKKGKGAYSFKAGHAISVTKLQRAARECARGLVERRTPSGGCANSPFYARSRARAWRRSRWAPAGEHKHGQWVN